MLRRRKTLALASAFACMFVGAAVSMTQVASAAGSLTGNAQPLSASGTPLTSGTQSTVFQVATKPLGGKCTGNSQNGVFVTSFITPSSVDVTTLTYDADGAHSANPNDPTYSFVDTTGTPWVRANTQADGGVTISPPLNLAVFDASSLPQGDYSYGMTCVGTSGPQQIFVGAIHINPDLSWTIGPDPAIPEFPFAIVLPVTAMAIIAGAGLFEYRRRRNSHQPSLAG
jgi:hypothetical protein